jgi:hypothetical protein
MATALDMNQDISRILYEALKIRSNPKMKYGHLKITLTYRHLSAV